MKASNTKSIILLIIFSFIFYSTSSLQCQAKTNLDIKTDSIITKDNSTSFRESINNYNYTMEIISEEKIENVKKQFKLKQDNLENNLTINGYGTGLAPPSENDLNKLIGTVWIKYIEPYQQLPGAVYDLSSQIYFPKVGNQGGQGSCAAWALTYYAYGYLEAKDYSWDASSGDPKYLMSPAWTYNKVATSNYGSWMTDNAQIIVDWGCATLETLPYDDSDYHSWGNESAWREATRHRALDYYLMDFNETNPDLTISTIKSFINSETPVTFALHSTEFSAGFSDGNFIISSMEYDSNSFDHAQCIVGFNDTITDDGDVGAFKIVNSWGTGFGDNGYYWLTYECLKEIGFTLGDFYLHLCVITDRIDYQPDLIATWEFSTAPTRMGNIIQLSVGQYNTPLKGLLEFKTPWYTYDTSYTFPNFMALDISEFKPYDDACNRIFFHLDIGESITTGKIISFFIERYIGGLLKNITTESRDVPQTTPGYVCNTFLNLDHDLKVILEGPQKAEVNNTYCINATVINNGIYNENNIFLYLNLNGFLVDSKSISTLLIGENDTIGYNWTPLEYGRYNFSTFVPNIPYEEFLCDNHAFEVIFIHEITIFNGMYIYYSHSREESNSSSYISYNHVSDSIFNVTREKVVNGFYSTGFWEVDATNRIMNNSNGIDSFGDGYHSPLWIYTEIQIGDIIPIAIDKAGDYDFQVRGGTIYNLIGYGLVEVWVFEQIGFSDSLALYEKSTGVLLNGTFFYGIGNRITFEFIESNLNFTLAEPSNLIGGIPGYNLYLVVSLVSIITIMVLKKRIKFKI